MTVNRFISLIILIFAFGHASTFGSNLPDSVYICTGTATKCYHIDPECNGLNFCRACVKKIHKSSIPSRYRLCKNCIESASPKSQKVKKVNPKKNSKKSKPRKQPASPPPRTQRDEPTPLFISTSLRV